MENSAQIPTKKGCMTSLSEAAALSTLNEVSISWCGTKYNVEVPKLAKVRELKRKVAEVTLLPPKRQKYLDPTHKHILKNDDALVSEDLSSLSASVIGLTQMGRENYVKIYYASNKNGLCIVTDYRESIKDFDGSKITNLYRGTYQMATINIECYIQKETKENPIMSVDSFNLMKMFAHSSAIRLQNMFVDSGYRRLVLSRVGGTLTKWMEKYPHCVIHSKSDGVNIFTPSFRGLIVDLVVVLEQLIKQNLCPKNFSKRNLYLNVVNDEPHLQVFFTDVECMNFISQQKQLKTLWSDVKKIALDHSSNLSTTCTSFCDFIGQGGVQHAGKCLSKDLEKFPDCWSYEMKGSYLIVLTSASQDIRAAVNKSGVSWPKDTTGDAAWLIQKLRKMMPKAKWVDLEGQMDDPNVNLENIEGKMDDPETIKNDPQRRFTFNYSIKYPYDFVRLGRNLHKHFFTLPPEVQAYLGGSQEGVLRQLEEGCPDIWCKIYVVLGFPS